jgi:hypothetical protein
MVLPFPEGARRNAERQAVGFGVEIGEYGARFGFSAAGFESGAERKLRRRQFTEDGSVEINGRDLREGDP